MNIVKGFCIILAYYFLGMLISHLIGNFIPGNIIGMLLLFASLCLKLISPSSVESISKALSKNMAIFFIPAGVGLMSSFHIISQNWIPISVVAVVSTVLVIVVVGLLQEKLGRSEK